VAGFITGKWVAVTAAPPAHSMIDEWTTRVLRQPDIDRHLIEGVE
jgi:hypothetical protein